MVEDRVARARLDRDSRQDVEGDRVASAGDGPADRVARGVVADDHAVDLVAQRGLAGDVGADAGCPATRLLGGRGAVEPHSPVVGRDQVPGRGRGAADRVAGRAESISTPSWALGIGVQAGLVGADQVACTRFRVDVGP